MTNKVVVRLEGGLGNQLHQYAYGLILANKINADLYLDIQFLDNYSKKLNVTYRDYELNKFVTSCKFYKSILSSQLILRFIKKFKILNKILNFLSIDVVSEYIPLELFDNKKMKLIYLHGIMGRYSDYVNNVSFVKKNLKINPKFNSVLDVVKNHINYNESVSIHIRRTDYLKKGSIHHVLEMDYYKNAIEIIKRKIDSPKFFIFSDDMKFIQQNFDIDGDIFNYMNYTADNAAFFDFLAIKECKHHILANSTFSWWASFIGTSEEAICIAPSVNLTNEVLNLEESYPPTWIVV